MHFLSFLKYYEMVMLARKWLNAYVSCCPIKANGLSNIILKINFLSWTRLFKPRGEMY